MLISILRTIVPALWGSVIGWALTLLPVLEPLRADLLAYGDFAVPVIAAVIIGGWYALWRWLEPLLPDWLTRILLGSAKSPIYETRATVDTYASGGPLDDFSESNGRREAIDSYPISDEHETTQSPARE